MGKKNYKNVVQAAEKYNILMNTLKAVYINGEGFLINAPMLRECFNLQRMVPTYMDSAKEVATSTVGNEQITIQNI